MTNRKLILMLSLILLMSGCGGAKGEGGKSSYEKIHKTLVEMESYAAEIDLQLLSNRGKNTYSLRQFSKTSGEYRIETLSPEIVQGNVTTFDGKMVNHYNPRVQGKISVEASDSKETIETLLTSFMKNYSQSTEVSVYAGSFDEGECTVLEAKIPGDHPYLSVERLWVNNETLTPVQLIIYDADQSERILVTYNRFEYNVKLEDRVFSLR